MGVLIAQDSECFAHPSDSKLSKVRDMPGVTKIPSNACAIANTNHIYGPDLGGKRGRQ